ncbi:MAG: hypothetical protein C6W58_04930 [Bacillaceae bacterium]|mgnify:CR=1 FL=1|jgi:Uncharacterized protein conserved in bacteria|uniref:Core domain-containing protein n=2 Tax=Aeribacillus TaxID=1055323 RepID=A0A165Y2V9_9BACI|nr:MULTISPECIES: HesB/YadR/YfhF family protein [Aeribacillus]AXI38770.1 hypothetical protein CX649_03390 [Bacillaceae bacterium ZC4]REJ19662.1 MAG: hypothetical protein C6W58_04930 [Bacillaceae bacterium]ASS91301.1 hypothetical protein AP3564_14735 [Aeribacillus pallidus]AXI38838.1 hypothetical protein CX649_03760 [Bacillaceae bacterium ZC4]KZM55614.1 hypothetical protein A3Q35_11115 [Aeribacillus pallidus]
MKLNITDDAAKWYKEELELNEGDAVRFFVRYGGCGHVQSGFSLGIAKEAPNQIGIKAEKLGVTFYVEHDDLWYFDNHDVTIQLDEKIHEPVVRLIN